MWLKLADDVSEMLAAFFFKVNCNNKEQLDNHYIYFEDETDKDFRNVVVSQPKPHTVSKSKNQDLYFGIR